MNIDNPLPMDLVMPGHDELPEVIPKWGVRYLHDKNVMVMRDVPEIRLSCGYTLQFPEQERLATPIRERYVSRNKYAVPHQSNRECLRRVSRSTGA